MQAIRLLPVLLLVGCIEPPNLVGHESDSGKNAEKAMAAWQQQSAAANCARDMRCGTGHWASEDVCLEWFRNLPSYIRYFGAIDRDAYLAANYTLAAPEVLAGCIDALDNSACDDARTSYEACLDTLVPRSPVPSGGLCTGPTPPFFEAPGCAAGLVCEYSGCNPTCQPLKDGQSEGGQCRYDRDCTAGLSCMEVCTSPENLPDEGQECDDTVCKRGLYCDFQRNLCVRPAAQNEPCDPNPEPTVSCLNGLACEVDSESGAATCRPYAQHGDVCPRDINPGSSHSCVRGDWCVFDSPDAPTGICGVPPLAVGSPCSLYSDDGGYFCPYGQFPQFGDTAEADATSCACMATLDLGSPCTSDYQCNNGRCLGDDPSTQHCVPWLQVGEACTVSDDDSSGACASGRCDPMTATCVAADTCP